jgi:hypothetical protein
MNYSSDGTKAFTVETKGLDQNGNRMRHITFYKKDEDGDMIHYKTARTNEFLDGLAADRIIEVWGKEKKH